MENEITSRIAGAVSEPLQIVSQGDVRIRLPGQHQGTSLCIFWGSNPSRALQYAAIMAHAVSDIRHLLGQLATVRRANEELQGELLGTRTQRDEALEAVRQLTTNSME